MKETLDIAIRKMQPKVADVISGWLDGVTHDDFQVIAGTHLSVEHVQEKITVIERYLPGFLAPGKKVLEVGCGFGAFTVFGRALYGYDTTAIEPDPFAHQCARELAELAGVECSIERCVGERLIFPDESFEFVYSSNVLEHVDDPDKVLAEAVRVLKPGGYLFFTYPNYCSFWEGHYGVMWLPCMPKPLAKLYVRLWGRNPKYIDTLQLVNVARTKRMLKSLSGRVDVISLGSDLWKERMSSLKFGEWGLTSKLKKILAFAYNIPYARELGISLGLLMNWYYPIILVLRKK